MSAMFNYTSTSKFYGSSFKTGTELYRLVYNLHNKLTFDAHNEIVKLTKLKNVNSTLELLDSAIKKYKSSKTIFDSANTLSSDGKALLKKPTSSMYTNLVNARKYLKLGKKNIKLAYYQKEIADCDYFIKYAQDALSKSNTFSKQSKKYSQGLHFETVTGSAIDYDYTTHSYVNHKTTGKKLVAPNYKKAIIASNKVMTSTQINNIKGWITSAENKKNKAQSRFNSINGGK